MTATTMTRQQWFHLHDLALALRGTTTALLPVVGGYGNGNEAKDDAERAVDLSTAAKLLADDLYRLVDTLNEGSVYDGLPDEGEAQL